MNQPEVTHMNPERIDRPTEARGFTALVLILVLAWASCRNLWPDSNADADAAPEVPSMERVIGTVKAFDTSAHALSVITGVGYALRVVRITVPVDVAVQGAGPQPPKLEPGCIVRVELGPAGTVRAASATRVATSITVLRLPQRGRTP